MIGLYFSGTGNTKHCVEYFVGTAGSCYSIEDAQSIAAIKENDQLVFGYPVYFSNLPKLLRDFVNTNAELWRGRRIFVIATMGLFSGDGSGMLARLLRRHGAIIVGGLHLTMPNCIIDGKSLLRTDEENQAVIRRAEQKMDVCLAKLQNQRAPNGERNPKEGPVPKEGLTFVNRMAGLLFQRLYFYRMTARYSNKVRCDTTRCTTCGVCAKGCPMNNIRLTNDGPLFHGRCTLCYRCVTACPMHAITLLGKKIQQ